MASAAFQSVPGQEIVAWAGFTNADIAPSLGRNLAGGVFGRTVFDVIEPGSAYGERLNQLDLRLTNAWRLPGTQRQELMLDVYNALNSDAIIFTNPLLGFGSRLRPQGILLSRFFKVGASFNF